MCWFILVDRCCLEAFGWTYGCRFYPRFLNPIIGRWEMRRNLEIWQLRTDVRSVVPWHCYFPSSPSSEDAVDSQNSTDLLRFVDISVIFENIVYIFMASWRQKCKPRRMSSWKYCRVSTLSIPSYSTHEKTYWSYFYAFWFAGIHVCCDFQFMLLLLLVLSGSIQRCCL